MRRRAAGCILACVCSFSAALAQDREGGDGPHVLSADLCADAFVLALVPRERIIAVSWQAGQPVSAAPDWAQDLPRAWGEAERLVTLDPDLAVFGPGGPGRAADSLAAAGIGTVTLGWGEDFAIVRDNASAIGAAAGTAVEAQAFIADLDARLARLDARTQARGTRPSVFYLNVSGGTAGSGTLVDAVIRAAGGRNAAAEAGAEGWTPADPEWALRVDPDLIVTSYFRDGFNSIRDTGARHSAYRRLLRAHPRIDVPSADWSCAGPRLIEAAEAIADALDALAAGGA